jgi:hypothetical protein
MMSRGGTSISIFSQSLTGSPAPFDTPLPVSQHREALHFY